ncbi:MAG: transglycosylase SLT domain-containing protein [Pseudomonadota bacterium]
MVGMIGGARNNTALDGAALRLRRAIYLALALSLPALASPAAAANAANVAALPRVDAVPETAADLPAILSAADAGLYRRIFQVQRRGEWAAADADIARLKDRRLAGHVLAQRYLHPTRYRSTYAELATWLDQYADHPDAPTIYRLAQRRAPTGAPPLKRPAGEALSAGWSAEDLGPPLDPPAPPGLALAGEAQMRAAALKAQIRARLREGEVAAASQLLHTREAARLLSAGEYDHLKAQIAAGYFTHGEDGKAIELASEAAQRSGHIVPRANWIAGLALFRQEKFAKAAGHFEALARTPDGQAWDLAAGAFWAARSQSRSKNFAVVNYWFALAAQHPRTFYGLLANRSLLHPSPFGWQAPELTEADLQLLLRSPAGLRAFALLQAGEDTMAERELRRAYSAGGPGRLRALLAVAMRANMPGLSMRLGRELSELDGRPHDGALYPVPRWQPIGGYEVDRALVFAFMRQESAFNPQAVSPKGARGLMQLMPQTAAFMDGRTFRGRAEGLFDPELNVTLGQRYIKHLLENEVVQGDLIRLAAAYNGGPGNLARWKRKKDMVGGDTRDDALLFVESLPAPETRHFIIRILYNYAVYADRLGQPTPAIDAIAAGAWPTYIARDGEAIGAVRSAKN